METKSKTKQTVGAILGLGFLFFCGISSGFGFLPELAVYIPFGWIGFLRRTLPRVTTNGPELLFGLAVMAAFAGMSHHFCRWLYDNLPRSDSSRLPAQWPLRWTALLVSGIIVLFLMSMAAVGIVHQTVWLVTMPEPFLQDGWGDRFEIGSIKSNMYTAQLAVEDYASTHDGNYPADTPDGLAALALQLKNPLAPTQPAFGGGIPFAPGQVGYVHPDYGPQPYSIYGFGKDALLSDYDHRLFILPLADSPPTKPNLFRPKAESDSAVHAATTDTAR